jgi:hypothetical protein
VNAVFVMAILDVISGAHLAAFVVELPNYLKYSYIFQLFFVYHNLCRGWLTEFSFYLKENTLSLHYKE